MEQQIQDLIASIRKEGIDTANAKSAEIIREAEEKAAAIIKEAEEKSSRLVADAEKEIELRKSSAEASIKQAARDASLLLKKSIEERYTMILRDKARASMKGKALIELIRTALSSDAAGKDVEISPSDMDEIRSDISSEFSSEIEKGLEIRSSKSVSSGFRIVEKDGSGYVDYSADECIKLILPYLSDSLKEILG